VTRQFDGTAAAGPDREAPTVMDFAAPPTPTGPLIADDERAAVAVIATGLLASSGPTQIQVLWLIAVATAVLIGRLGPRPTGGHHNDDPGDGDGGGTRVPGITSGATIEDLTATAIR